MSHFIFGEFQTKHKISYSTEWITSLLFSFDQKIDFFNGISKMIQANSKISENERVIFCITSENQLKNSDDVLFPYDKFPDQLLIHAGVGRVDFIKKCRDNLNILKNGLVDFIKEYRPIVLRVFVSDAYDIEFECVETTLDGLIDDLEEQVIEDFFLDSKIYEIRIKK